MLTAQDTLDLAAVLGAHYQRQLDTLAGCADAATPTDWVRGLANWIGDVAVLAAARSLDPSLRARVQAALDSREWCDVCGAVGAEPCDALAHGGEAA